MNKLLDLTKMLAKNGLYVSVAESFTGGAVSALLTSVDGASRYFKESCVCYSDEVKQRVLRVSEQTIKKYSAVSAQTAKEMALGLYELTRSELVIATTGYASSNVFPSQNDGLCYIAAGYDGEIEVREYRFEGDRRENIRLGAENSIELAYSVLCRHVPNK